MKGRGSYVPPLYVPLGQSDAPTDYLDSSSSSDENEDVNKNVVDVAASASRPPVAAKDPTQWSSGICACFDDSQSCMLLSAL